MERGRPVAYSLATGSRYPAQLCRGRSDEGGVISICSIISDSILDRYSPGMITANRTTLAQSWMPESHRELISTSTACPTSTGVIFSHTILRRIRINNAQAARKYNSGIVSHPQLQVQEMAPPATPRIRLRSTPTRSSRTRFSSQLH